MQRYFTWILALGVLAGLGLRAVAADAAHQAVCVEESSHCGGSEHGHHHGPAEHDHEDKDKECPPDHHHHSCCFQGMPMTPEIANAYQIAQQPTRYLRVRDDCEIQPDDPFLNSEKPPQI